MGTCGSSRFSESVEGILKENPLDGRDGVYLMMGVNPNTNIMGEDTSQ